MRVRDKDDLSHWFKFFLVGVAEFEKLGILKETTGAKRSRLFLFSAYFTLFE